MIDLFPSSYNPKNLNGTGGAVGTGGGAGGGGGGGGGGTYQDVDPNALLFFPLLACCFIGGFSRSSSMRDSSIERCVFPLEPADFSFENFD